jgi:hypothetical protein
MKIRFNMVIEDTEPIELLNMERGELQAGNIGLSSAEVKSLLSCAQKALIDAQATVYARHQQCEKCKNALRCKGHNTIVLRSLYRKIDVDSPRFYRCICRTPRTSSRASFSPLAEILTERTTPEFQYFQAKWASLMSYGMTLNLFNDVLPIGDDLSKEGIRDNVARIVQRLDRELGEEPKSIITQGITEQLPNPLETQEPLVVGIDGGYVHARDGSRQEGCFEVIVGKSIPTKGDTKCFGFVQRIEGKPKRRLQDILDSQGFQANQPIVFLSDGADTVRNLQRDMSPNAEHILDWFHVTMRLTVMGNLVAGLHNGRMRSRSTVFADLLESVKWNIWHGKVDRSLERAKELRKKLAKASAVSRENARKLRGKLGKFIGYISANRDFIPNYGKRYRAEKLITTSFAESTVDQVISRRFVKKQKMRWTERGCHNVLQLRTRVINDELRSVMQGWYPGLQIAA